MTLQRPEPTPLPGSKLEFDEKSTSMPLFSILLILGNIYCYTMSAKKEEFWIAHNCWSISNVASLLQAHNWGAICNLIPFSNLASFNMIHMGLSMYFIWVFGGHIESKIGSNRYMPLLLLGMTLPWVLLQFEAAGQPSMTYFGSLFLLCAIIGAYVVLPPVPLKNYGSGNVIPKNQIFRKEEKKDPRSK